MITVQEVVVRCRVSRRELEHWVARSWIRPAGEADGWRFSDADLARVEMICDLVHDLAVDPDALDIILPLIDQVYTLRRAVHEMRDAIEALPVEQRDAVRNRLKVRRGL